MNIIYSIHCRKEVTRRQSKHKKRSLKGDYDRFAAEVVVAAPRRIKNCIEKSFLSARADFPKGGNVWDKKRSLGNWLLLFLKKRWLHFNVSLWSFNHIQSPWKWMADQKKKCLNENSNVCGKLFGFCDLIVVRLTVVKWGFQGTFILSIFRVYSDVNI